MKIFVHIATLVLLSLICAEISSAQVCSPAAARIPIVIHDNGSGRDTIWFGHDLTGTYGLNTALCEVELPPQPPPGVFDARFVNIPGHEGQDTPAGLGQGFKEDYRMSLWETLVDTFRVKFQPSDVGYPVTFIWSTSVILSMCDSAWLQDEFGGVIFRTRMHRDATHTFLNPAFSSALLITFGGRLEGVETRDGQTPERFCLDQNYPNPFNPTTNFGFRIANFGFVSIKVYDMLGQEVATLVNEELMPGSYSVQLDAGKHNLSSGTYFYRLTAAGFVQTRRLIVLR